MAMSVFDEIANDLGEIFREFGKVITIESRRFTALVAEPEISLELESGGLASQGNFVVKLSRKDWQRLTHRNIGATIGYGDGQFRVIRIVDRPPHPLILLTVEPV
jgi:hypothetical protein